MSSTTPSHDHAARDTFVAGLKDAHALENQALSIMKPQIDRLEHYPEVVERLRRHVTETEGQIARLDRILSELGEQHSTFKDTGGRMMGGMAAMGHAAASDEVIKNGLADYAFENYEVASYRSLITLAEMVGLSDARVELEASLKEEEDMARWIGDHLEEITRRYVALRDSGATAKH